MKKVVKKVKNNNDNEPATKEDVRHLGVMMENMQDSISFMAENLVGLSGKVDNLEVKVDNLEVKVDNLEVKVDNIDKRLTNVEIDVSIIKSDVKDIRSELSEKVDRKEFLTLVKRVDKLEAKK